MFDWVKLRVSGEVGPSLLKLNALPVPRALPHSLIGIKYRLAHCVVVAVSPCTWTLDRSCESVGAIKLLALKFCA